MGIFHQMFSKEISIITIIQPRKFLGNFWQFLSLILSIISSGMIFCFFFPLLFISHSKDFFERNEHNEHHYIQKF